jgi:hypothetical protein
MSRRSVGWWGRGASRDALAFFPESPGLNPCDDDVEDRPQCGEHRDLMQVRRIFRTEPLRPVPANIPLFLKHRTGFSSPPANLSFYAFRDRAAVVGERSLRAQAVACRSRRACSLVSRSFSASFCTCLTRSLEIPSSRESSARVAFLRAIISECLATRQVELTDNKEASCSALLVARARKAPTIQGTAALWCTFGQARVSLL